MSLSFVDERENTLPLGKVAPKVWLIAQSNVQRLVLSFGKKFLKVPAFLGRRVRCIQSQGEYAFEAALGALRAPDINGPNILFDTWIFLKLRKSQNQFQLRNLDYEKGYTFCVVVKLDCDV